MALVAAFMNTAMRISELIERSGSLTVPEAVAIVLSLIDGHSSSFTADLREPYGPPSPDNVELRSDGTVICTASATTPAVSEIAILLEELLAGAPKIPGGLRYAIGRALLDVEAPPFDSLGEFAHSLARFEEGDRREVLRALADRAAGRLAPIAAPRLVAIRPPVPASPPATVDPIDRRLHGPRPDQLRRELRAADELLFTRSVSGDRVAIVARDASSQPPRRGHAVALAAVAALLLALAGTALMLSPGHAPAVPPPVALQPPIASAPARTDGPLTVPQTRTPRPSPAERERVSRAEPDRPKPAIANITERHTSADDGWLVPTLDVNQRPVFSPSFASNGSAVFFHTGDADDERSALMSADASGDQLRVMTILDDGARNYHVQVSPDGRQIAFDSDRDGDRGVYVANRDGSKVHRVSGPGFAAVPTWSPDGRRLALVRAEPNNARVWNLWLLDLASGASARLTSYQHGQPWAASWFPDGRRVAYTHEDRLYILDLQTKHADSFATPVAEHLLRTPAVSPDGSRIVFQVSHNGMWMLDLADGSMRCVLQDPTAEEFAWAPDSRRVAFHSRRDGQWGVYVTARRD